MWMFEFELSRHQFKRTSPGILSRPRRIASTLLKGYVPGLCLRLKNSFMNFSCFYIALIPLPFDSTTALSPSPRFLFVANGLWGRSTARRSCVFRLPGARTRRRRWGGDDLVIRECPRWRLYDEEAGYNSF